MTQERLPNIFVNCYKYYFINGTYKSNKKRTKMTISTIIPFVGE